MAVRELPVLRMVQAERPLGRRPLREGMCIEPKLKGFELVVSGRDWCNLYKAARQKQIGLLQEGKMKD